MNTIPVEITIDEAIKYYKSGGTLRELALKACPNLPQIIEDKRHEECLLRLQKKEMRKENLLQSAKEVFKIGKIFRSKLFSDDYAVKVVSEIEYCPNHETRLWCEIERLTTRGNIRHEIMLVFVDTTASKINPDKTQIATGLDSIKNMASCDLYKCYMHYALSETNMRKCQDEVISTCKSRIERDQIEIANLNKSINEKCQQRDTMLQAIEELMA